MATTTTESPRLKQRFESELKSQLQTELGLTNVMQVPQPVKIVVNMGVGRATQQRSLLDGTFDLTIITGQKPLVTKAKKSIASFKLREGNEIDFFALVTSALVMIVRVGDPRRSSSERCSTARLPTSRSSPGRSRSSPRRRSRSRCPRGA